MDQGCIKPYQKEGTGRERKKEVKIDWGVAITSMGIVQHSERLS